jgi:hypothetical protein
MTALTRRRRQVVVSLTALVDLLFMIMFMQYLELRRSNEKTARERAEAVERQRQAEEGQQAAEQRKMDAIVVKEDVLEQNAFLAIDRDRARNEANRLREEVGGLKAQLAERGKELERLQGKIVEVAKKAERTREEAAEAQRRIGSMLSGMFAAIDRDQIAAVLEPTATGKEVEQMLTELQGDPEQTAAEAVQVLRRAAEVQKRVDIWEVHLRADESVRVRPPDRGSEGEEWVLSFRNEDDLATQFIEHIKDYRTEKDLAIVLYTHEEVFGSAIRDVKKALDQVKTRWSSLRDVKQNRISISAPIFAPISP